MEPSRPLAVVTPTLDGDVLARLAVVDYAFTPGQLQAMLGHSSVNGVRKVLNRLAEQGIVDAERISSAAITYSLNREHLAARAIIALASTRDTFYDRLRDELQEWGVRPKYGAVFGSWARGQATVESDIDIFLVQPHYADIGKWDSDVAALERAATRWTGNDARALVLTEAAIREHPQDPVLISVAQEGRDIIGDGHWLRRIVKDGARR